MNKSCLLALCFALSLSAAAQSKKIVVIGSSTAAGSGARPIDSSWVNRLRVSLNRDNSDGRDTIVTNLAVGGYTSYELMPTGFSAPAGRPGPDTAHNITAALQQAPDVIIINLPSNDIGKNFSKDEFMNNMRLQSGMAVDRGIRCFISTTQPRNFRDNNQRRQQRELVDSLYASFGPYIINFWDDLVSSDTLYRMRDDLNSGDDIHLNNKGHRYLFERVFSTDLFTPPLPVRKPAGKKK